MEFSENISGKSNFDWIFSSFMHSTSSFLNFLYPPVCMVCETGLQEHEKIVCSTCLKDAERIEYSICQRCGIPLSDDAVITNCRWCRQITPDIQTLRSAFRFGGVVEKIVHSFKYGNWTKLSSLMVAGMQRVMLKCENLQGINLILPVPLHSVRRRERGYNQSELLAKELSKVSGVKTETNLLNRIRNTPSQTNLNFEQRKANVNGAFKLVDTSVIKGASILLVDDVLTTGSTVSACAEVLSNAGAGDVSVLTYARAVS